MCYGLAQGADLIRTFSRRGGRSLLEVPRCSEGFGYDPLFYYRVWLLLGEIDAERKMTVSHRWKALEQFSGMCASGVAGNSSGPALRPRCIRVSAVQAKYFRLLVGLGFELLALLA